MDQAPYLYRKLTEVLLSFSLAIYLHKRCLGDILARQSWWSIQVVVVQRFEPLLADWYYS
jgi:hypothetical protein